MTGTPYRLNRATVKPLLIAGVEKRLMMLNVLFNFPLVAAGHFHCSAVSVGIGCFIVFHLLFMPLSKTDPHFAKVFKRNTRYAFRAYFPALGHPRSR